MFGFFSIFGSNFKFNASIAEALKNKAVSIFGVTGEATEAMQVQDNVSIVGGEYQNVEIVGNQAAEVHNYSIFG